MMPRTRFYFVCGMTLLWWITAGAVVTQAQTSPSQIDDPLVRLAKRLTAEALNETPTPTPNTLNFPQSPSVPAIPTTPSLPQSPQIPSILSANDRSVDRLAASPQPVLKRRTADVVISPKEALPLGMPGQSGLETRSNSDASGGTGGTGGGVLSDSSSWGGWVLNTITALGVVIGLIYFVRFGLARLWGRTTAIRAGSVIQVLSRTSLGQRNQVLLLQLGQRILVVGDSSGRLQTLSEISDPQEVASLLATIDSSKPNSLTRSFSDLLKGEDAAHDEVSFEESEHTVDRVRDELSTLLSRIRRMGGGGAS